MVVKKKKKKKKRKIQIWSSQWGYMVNGGGTAGGGLLCEKSPVDILRWCEVLLAGCKKSGPFNTPYLLRSGHWWPEPSLAWLLFIIDTQALKLMIIFSGQLAELRHWRSFVLAIWLLLLSVVRLFKIPTWPTSVIRFKLFFWPLFSMLFKVENGSVILVNKTGFKF